MHTFLKSALGASAIALGLGAAALPAQAAGSTVTLDHVVAKVIIIPEARNTINAEIRNSGRGGLAKPALTVQGSDLVVSGGVDKDRLRNCHLNSHNHGVNFGLFRHIDADDMPVITLRVPRDVTVIADGAIDAQVGAMNSINVTQKHCGDWRLGDVANELSFSLEGVSDMHAGHAGSANIQLEGMGDVHVASTGALNAGLQGMGDLVVDQVNGPVKVSLQGMGDLHIKGGHATTFTASLEGMGDIKFDGTADTVDASSDGMGDITIAHATGEVHKSNSGFSKIHVGK